MSELLLFDDIINDEKDDTYTISNYEIEQLLHKHRIEIIKEYKSYMKIFNDDHNINYMDKIVTNITDFWKILSNNSMLNNRETLSYFINNELCHGKINLAEYVYSLKNDEHIIVSFLGNIPRGILIYNIRNDHISVEYICSSGRFLFYLLTIIAKELGIVKIRLHSIRDKDTIVFYKSLGFKMIQQFSQLMELEI